MNRKNLIACSAAALFAATSFSAHAMRGGDEAYGESPAPAMQSTLTRAEVMAEVLASKQRLSVDKAYGAEPAAETPSTLTREAVLAELNAARADGRMDRGGEYSTPDSVLMAQIRYSQAQAATLQARNDAQREVERQQEVVAQAAMQSAPESLMASDPQGAQDTSVAALLAGETLTSPEPSTPQVPAEPVASGNDMITESNQPEDPSQMPQIRPVIGEPGERKTTTYLELDDSGMVVPFMDDEQP